MGDPEPCLYKQQRPNSAYRNVLCSGVQRAFEEGTGVRRARANAAMTLIKTVKMKSFISMSVVVLSSRSG